MYVLLCDKNAVPVYCFQFFQFVKFITSQKQCCIIIGIQLPRAVLIYGPSGSGKTMLVRALAHSMKLHLVTVGGSAILSA